MKQKLLFFLAGKQPGSVSYSIETVFGLWFSVFVIFSDSELKSHKTK